MLVLSRRVNGRIFIDVPPDYRGGRIEVLLVDIRTPHQARIGIEADPEIHIVRAELVDEGS